MPAPVFQSSRALFESIPPAVPPAVPAAPETGVRIRRYAPRKKGGFDWDNLASLVGVLVILGVGGLLVGMFVNQSTLDLGGKRSSLGPRPVPQPAPVNVQQGGGSASPPREPAPEPKHGDEPVASLVAAEARGADEHLSNALKSARIGAFDEADLSATKALKLNPNDARADGMRLVIAYLRQYTKLADDALEALNGNDTDIDLGGKKGKVAFVERDGDTLVVRVRGKNERVTIKELNGMPGARFRITQAFLDRAQSPVNDLIIGARIFVSQQDERGRLDAERSANLAEGRWRKAAASNDNNVVGHANSMLHSLGIK